MKRTGFKRLTYAELIEKQEKAKLKPKIKPKKKKSNANILKRAKVVLWELCKIFVRRRDGDTCFTCGKKGLSGSNQQTGHFIPSSVCGGYLRYDIRNLAVQCYSCNINAGGNGAIFNQHLRVKYGNEFVDQIFQDKEKTIKLDIIYVESLIEEYRQALLLPEKELFKYTLAFRTTTQ